MMKKPGTQKVTAGQLRRLVESALSEVTMTRELDSDDLIQFGDAWASLGDAVTQQVKTVLDQGPDADVNPNAIELALQRLEGFNEQLDQSLQEYLDDYFAGSSEEPPF